MKKDFHWLRLPMLQLPDWDSTKSSKFNSTKMDTPVFEENLRNYRFAQKWHFFQHGRSYLHKKRRSFDNKHQFQSLSSIQRIVEARRLAARDKPPSVMLGMFLLLFSSLPAELYSKEVLASKQQEIRRKTLQDGCATTQSLRPNISIDVLLANRRQLLKHIIVNDEHKLLYCYVPKVCRYCQHSQLLVGTR